LIEKSKIGQQWIVSDERYFAYFYDSYELAPLIPDVEGSQCIQLPCNISMISSPDEFLWIGSGTDVNFIVIRCGDNRSEYESGENAPYCSLRSGSLSYRSYPSNFQPFPLVRDDRAMDFTYEPRYDVYAYIMGEQTIRLNRYDAYDLSDQIDGAIVDIAWLPSLFY